MKYKGFIIDMDGTVLQGGVEIPGSFEMLGELVKREIPFRLITNTVSKSVDEMAANIKKLGFGISSQNILNPIKAVNHYLEEKKTSSYYFVGPSYIMAQLAIQSSFEGVPEYVILCDFEHIDCSFELLNQIYKFLLAGAKLITTSYSDFYLSKEGPKIDTGSFTKMFENLCQRQAVILGKPSPNLYEIALKQMGTSKEETIAIGDDVLTDIKGAKEYGITSALVKTGKYKAGDENKINPDFIIETFRDIKNYI